MPRRNKNRSIKKKNAGAVLPEMYKNDKPDEIWEKNFQAHLYNLRTTGTFKSITTAELVQTVTFTRGPADTSILTISFEGTTDKDSFDFLKPLLHTYNKGGKSCGVGLVGLIKYFKENFLISNKKKGFFGEKTVISNKVKNTISIVFHLKYHDPHAPQYEADIIQILIKDGEDTVLTIDSRKPEGNTKNEFSFLSFTEDSGSDDTRDNKMDFWFGFSRIKTYYRKMIINQKPRNVRFNLTNDSSNDISHEPTNNSNDSSNNSQVDIGDQPSSSEDVIGDQPSTSEDVIGDQPSNSEGGKSKKRRKSSKKRSKKRSRKARR